MTAPLRTGIRLAGATNDVHIMDFPTGKWSKIEPQGELPAPRAAHAAVAVGSMMVVQVCVESAVRPFKSAYPRHSHLAVTLSTCQVQDGLLVSKGCPRLVQLIHDMQGGIGPAGLASEDLHVLDFSTPDQPRWHRCAPPLLLCPARFDEVKCQ